MKTKLLKTFGLLLSVFAVSLTASAYDFKVGDIYYNITNKANKEVEVTYPNSGSYSGSVTIPAVVNYDGVSYVVTSIGESAFKESRGLTSINIPYSVTIIGENAFNHCTGLKSITIPNSVTNLGNYAFDGCYGLTSVTIPNSVTNIGEYAFDGCYGLTSITIPNSVTTIGESAFYYCDYLTKVEISDLASWCKINFGDKYANPLYYAHHLYLNGVEIKDMIIPNDVTYIGAYAFFYCRGLTSVTIPNSVTTIGNNAFEYCSNLTSITIPSSVTTIGKDAFYYCSGLTKVEISDLASWCKINFGDEDANPLSHGHHLYLNGVEIKDLVIPEGLTSINDYAFYYCRGLTSVTIPNSVTIIGNHAFFYCSGLISVTIPNSVTTIGNSAFQYCSNLTKVEISDLASWCKINFGNGYANPLSYAHHLYLNGVEIKDLVIPDGVTTISNCAFDGCSGLTSITIPNNVISIGNAAFYSCYGLTSVTIPNSVTNIGNYAFYDCYGLTNLSIGNHIQTIGSSAFANCNKLNTVNIYATEAPTMSSDSFPYNGATFHVPRGCKAKYVFLYNFGNIIDDLENAEDSVEEIFGDEKDVRVDIYNLQGQIIKLGADKADVKNLVPGLYIINGKKVMIR